MPQLIEQVRPILKEFRGLLILGAYLAQRIVSYAAIYPVWSKYSLRHYRQCRKNSDMPERERLLCIPGPARPGPGID